MGIQDSKSMGEDLERVTCQECGTFEAFYLGDHLLEEHNLTPEQYMAARKGARFYSEGLDSLKEAPKRQSAPTPEDLETRFFYDIPFSVNWDVPEEACLPIPHHYMVPMCNPLKNDTLHALTALKYGRTMWVHGLAGAGKDALFHAWSYLTRTPAINLTIDPDTDIRSWFYSQAFNSEGSYWEEGELLKALRDGYVSPFSQRRVPMLVLISDFDRAGKEQAEALRLIIDTTKQRVKGPKGVVYSVLGGTRIVVTANSSGAGDTRGRYVSARAIDATIMDRFERSFEFHWMDWKDEKRICEAKFPLLAEKCPTVLEIVGRTTEVVRAQIHQGEIPADMSHRGVCKWLGHAEDLLRMDVLRGKTIVRSDLLKASMKAFLDSLPDYDTRARVESVVEPLIRKSK